MGAARFGNFGFGATPQEAFNSAVSQARYEHGSGGYSGTIGEKHSFSLLTVPKGIAALDFMRWVRSAETSDDLPPEIPAEHRGAVRRAAEISDDKWGPAAAVEIVGQELEALKKRYNNVPPNARAFYFFGWASE